jgi:hypothetical protein
MSAALAEAQALHEAGDLAAAETAYRAVADKEPGSADALVGLATIELQRADPERPCSSPRRRASTIPRPARTPPSPPPSSRWGKPKTPPAPTRPQSPQIRSRRRPISASARRLAP